MDKDNKDIFRKVYGKKGSNSMIFNLPSDFAVDLGICKGDYLRISKKDDSIIIKKLTYKED